MAIIGIDLGTTNSLAAYYRAGKSILIPNEFGEYLTPSVVHINPKGEIIVGRMAKEFLITDPENTAAVFKRSMGVERIVYEIGKTRYSPEELSAFVIKKLVEDAKRELQEEIEEVVISVPAYFDDARRRATKRAGEIAGVRVERLINEPSAAALACWLMDRADESIYMVFDFGGGTLDVSVVECFDNVVSVAAVAGDNHLGGSDFDALIADYICQQFGCIMGLLPEEEQAAILRQAEHLKMLLSEQKSVELEIQAGEIRGKVRMAQQQLVNLSETLFKRISIPVIQVMQDCFFSPRDIRKVIMAGGSSKMEVVRSYVKKIVGQDVFTAFNPEEIVARGLGYYVGMKERRDGIRDIVMTDICPFSIGINVRNEEDFARPLFDPIIERNSVLPVSKAMGYSHVKYLGRKYTVKIYQGDEKYVDENEFLGSIDFYARPGKINIIVRLTYDINGILEVEVEVEENHKKYHKLIVKDGMDLNSKVMQRQLQKMEAVKKDPREEEENQYIISMAEIMYRWSRGERRKLIRQKLSLFEQAMDSGDMFRVRLARREMLELLRQTGDTIFHFDRVIEQLLEQKGRKEEK